MFTQEIIHYPTVRMIQHLGCKRIRERDLEFDSHMSGFVYKVRVDGQTLIKKEIPGPDTVDEFLYEVNALNSLTFSQNVISFYGVVVDDDEQNVKGLLIDYAAQGALIDVIYDSQEHGVDLSWSTREKWARQIVQGLTDIHEAGFVQGDFTLSNIVIDDNHNAKIIDINRRGCPVGWEPPEATPLIDSNQRISMYIGVKSDLYQLGMVLWALATLEDEPEAHRRPLRLDPEIGVPAWYRRMVETCLNDNPRYRLQGAALLAIFPEQTYDDEYDSQRPPSISVDDGYSVQKYVVDGYDHNAQPVIRTGTPQSDWYFSSMGHESGITSPGLSDDAYYYPPRGRSPPSPLPSNPGEFDTPFVSKNVLWSGSNAGPPSLSDVAPDESRDGSLKNSYCNTGYRGFSEPWQRR
jgi:serine/threonine protein kinase